MTAPAASYPPAGGGLSEVLASEEGPSLGAIFDLDGTLVAGYTALVFAGDRYRHGQVGMSEAARTLALAAKGFARRATFADVIALGASTWKGRSVVELEALSERLFADRIADRLYPEGRDLVKAHQRKGHTVVLASSATAFQVMPAARHLGITHVLCSQLEVSAGGVLTGGVVQPMMWGKGKAAAVGRFAALQGIDLSRSWFYSDGDEDEALMHLVGHPRPTNPRPHLASVARRRGWPVQRFSSRGGRPIGSVARNAVGLATLPAVGAVSAGVGLVSRNRRLAIDLALTHSIDLLLAVSGVGVSAVGEEHLYSHRPAVFIWNRANNFDPLIVAKLVGGSFTGVGPGDGGRDRLLGTIRRLCDIVFIDGDDVDGDDLDRDDVDGDDLEGSDAAAAAAALSEIAALARRGVSLLIAPERTSSTAGEIGHFHPDPLRIAVAAGIPVIPVVVRNATVLGSRNAVVMRPGTVDATVLPPLDVRGWDVDDLSPHVLAVRQMFVDTLERWPGTYS